MAYLDANGNKLSPPDPIHVVVADGDYKVKEIIVNKGDDNYPDAVQWYAFTHGYTDKQSKKRKIVITKGGPGSGHHGHAGRPGKIGGSAPGGGKGKGQAAGIAPPETTTLSTLPHDGNDKVGGLMNRTIGKQWVDASYDERGDVKSDIVMELGYRTGTDHDDVNSVIGQWAHSSNDGNLAALEMQETAAEVLGVELGEWQKARLEEARGFEGDLWENFQDREEDAFGEVANIEAEWNENVKAARDRDEYSSYVNAYRQQYAKKHAKALAIATAREKETLSFKKGLYDPSPLTKDQRKSFIQEMYNWTQDDLSYMGIGPGDPVTLVRGINRDYMDYEVGDVLDYKGNAIESWSLSRSVAADFATMDQSGTGMIVAITVPRKNIISTAVTGIGCLIEGEVIISGTVDGHKVRVYDLWQLDEVFDD